MPKKIDGKTCFLSQGLVAVEISTGHHTALKLHLEDSKCQIWYWRPTTVTEVASSYLSVTATSEVAA